jgi:hypothetical protein
VAGERSPQERVRERTQRVPQRAQDVIVVECQGFARRAPCSRDNPDERAIASTSSAQAATAGATSHRAVAANGSVSERETTPTDPTVPECSCGVLRHQARLDWRITAASSFARPRIPFVAAD